MDVDMRVLARRGAQVRLQELREEIASITGSFPDLTTGDGVQVPAAPTNGKTETSARDEESLEDPSTESRKVIMPVMCVQCALEAYVRSNGDPEEVRRGSLFDQTADEHKRQYHPNAQETFDRRQVLMKQASNLTGGVFVDPRNN